MGLALRKLPWIPANLPKERPKMSPDDVGWAVEAYLAHGNKCAGADREGTHHNPLIHNASPGTVLGFCRWVTKNTSSTVLNDSSISASIDELWIAYLEYCATNYLKPVVTRHQLTRRLKSLGAKRKRVGPNRVVMYSLPRIE